MQSQDNTPAAHVSAGAHRRMDSIDLWRFWAPLLGVLLLVVWRIADYYIDDAPGSAWHTPGPVAAPHATWETNCASCHQSSAPISATSWLYLGGRTNHTADAQCKSCHAGAEHHEAASPGDQAGCTACHREHRGREKSLVRVSDDQCTRCHASLKGHVAEGKESKFLDVKSFDRERKNHPEFRVLREKAADPGRLKFNHKLHMTSGMGLGEDSKPFTLAKIDERFRGSYRESEGQGDHEPVRLSCIKCHQRDSSDIKVVPEHLGGVPVSTASPAPVGVLPCSPSFSRNTARAATRSRLSARSVTTRGSGHVAVRHRLHPAEVRTFLEAHYLAEHLKGGEPALKRPLIPLPGKGLDAEAKKILDAVAKQVVRAEQDLFLSKKSCGECHVLQPPIETVPPAKLVESRVAPTGVKQVWFEHAAFNHTAHRLMECRACHARAYAHDETNAANPDASVSEKDVLLPGIATCVECHRPAGQGERARNACVECHRYHDGAHALSGKGSAVRAGPNAGTRTLEQFLQNKFP